MLRPKYLEEIVHMHNIKDMCRYYMQLTFYLNARPKSTIILLYSGAAI